MSTYELDDDVVSAWLNGHPEGNLAGALRAQLPSPEPDREYLIKDRQGDIWRWDVRQSAWRCLIRPTAYARWELLVRDYAPVTLYGPIS